MNNKNMKRKARVIAFYLPQFHPFKENDEWWGKGFTEWTNVGKAKPLFKGHYQPRVPADLGYYDLRCPWVREAQADMAREAGVEGFMYWHYWFGNGKTLMANIFQEVLESGKPDFPFCLGWANHSWSRRTWNSSAQYHKDMDLINQLYPGDDDYIQHFYSILPALKDKRYIRVKGKCLFVIYEPLGIPDAKHFMNLWNKLAIENGLEGFVFVGIRAGRIHDYRKLYQEVLDLGFDAVAPSNLPYAEEKVAGFFKKMIDHKLQKYLLRAAPLNKFKYEDIIKYMFTDFDRNEKSIPMIIPNWDRSPRGGRRAQIYTGSTPELFKKHIADALDIVKNRNEENRIIFLRSWNEWAEGNYMEPDLKFGHGYLDALREMILE